MRAAEEAEDDDDDDEAKDQRLAFVAFKAKLAHERYGLGPPNLEGWRAWRKQNWLKSSRTAIRITMPILEVGNMSRYKKPSWPSCPWSAKGMVSMWII